MKHKSNTETKQNKRKSLVDVVKDVKYIKVSDDVNKIMHIEKSKIFNKTEQLREIDSTCKNLLKNIDIDNISLVDIVIICSDITLIDISHIVEQVRSTLKSDDVFAHVVRKDYYKDEMEVHLIANGK